MFVFVKQLQRRTPYSGYAINKELHRARVVLVIRSMTHLRGMYVRMDSITPFVVLMGQSPVDSLQPSSTLRTFIFILLAPNHYK